MDFTFVFCFLLVFNYEFASGYHESRKFDWQLCVLKHISYAQEHLERNQKACAVSHFEDTVDPKESINCEISQKEFATKLQKHDNLYIVDVREQMEIDYEGKIPNSHLIPLGDVKAALLLSDVKFERMYGFTKPPQDGKDVIFYCHAGVRSLEATFIARKLGFIRARSLIGGIVAWKDFNLKQ